MTEKWFPLIHSRHNSTQRGRPNLQVQYTNKYFTSASMQFGVCYLHCNKCPFISYISECRRLWFMTSARTSVVQQVKTFFLKATLFNKSITHNSRQDRRHKEVTEMVQQNKRFFVLYYPQRWVCYIYIMLSWHMHSASSKRCCRWKKCYFGNGSLFSPQIGVDIKNPKHTL
jgi:hypothetical protein